MSEPVQLQPHQLQRLPNGTIIMGMKCMACEKLMTVRIPQSRIFNGPDVSIIALAHEKLDECEHCQQKYLFMINPFDEQGNMSFKWVKVELKPQSAIQGASEQEMKKAIEAAKALTNLKQ